MATNEGPQLDAGGPRLDAVPAATPNPFGDLVIASKNYWAGRTGREDPPAPTYRMVNGKKMLGRYMDPYGCQGHLRTQRNLWDKWYTGFFISCGIAVIFGEVTLLASLIVIPLYAAWYFSVKAKHTRQYKLYYAVQEEILRTGEPQWVPYDKARLNLIDRNPLAVWP